MQTPRQALVGWAAAFAGLTLAALIAFEPAGIDLHPVSGLVVIDALVFFGMLFLIRPWVDGWSSANRAWTILLLVPLFRMVSNLGDVFRGAEMGMEDFPAWTNFVWYAAAIGAIVGAFMIPHRGTTGPARWRLVLDIVAGAIALLTLTWLWYLEPLLAGGGSIPPTAYQTTVASIFVTIDVMVLVSAVIISTRRAAAGGSLQLVAITMSLAVNGLGNVLVTLLTSGRDPLGLSAASSMAVYGIADVILLGAVLVRGRATRVRSHEFDTPRVAIGPHLVTVTLLVTSVVSLLASPADRHTILLQLATLTVVMVLVGRQSLAIRETKSFLNRQRDQLVASVSHELRTPLTGVSGFASILAESFDYLSDEERLEYIGYISRQADHLGRIVGDLIGLARDTLTSVPLDPKPMLVGDLVSEAVHQVEEELLALKDIQVRIPQPMVLDIDHQRGIQILTNLIANAVKYGRGRVLVRATSQEGMVELTIGDDGDGVPLRFRADIFERFERGVHRLDANIPGTGLGLPIALALTKAHGGTITVGRCPELGGAEFRLTLPAVTIPGQKTGAALQTGIPVVSNGH